MHVNISKEIQRKSAFERAQEALRSLAVPTITPDGKLDEWGMIEGMVADYGRLHKDELKVFLEGVKMVRHAQKNQTASNTSKTMRHALCMPPDLMRLLEKYVPDLFSNKDKMRKFMRRFPGFCIPANI